MKKLLSLLVILSLCIAAALSLTSCFGGMSYESLSGDWEVIVHKGYLESPSGDNEGYLTTASPSVTNSFTKYGGSGSFSFGKTNENGGKDYLISIDAENKTITYWMNDGVQVLQYNDITFEKIEEMNNVIKKQERETSDKYPSMLFNLGMIDDLSLSKTKFIAIGDNIMYGASYIGTYKDKVDYQWTPLVMRKAGVEATDLLGDILTIDSEGLLINLDSLVKDYAAMNFTLRYDDGDDTTLFHTGAENNVGFVKEGEVYKLVQDGREYVVKSASVSDHYMGVRLDFEDTQTDMVILETGDDHITYIVINEDANMAGWREVLGVGLLEAKTAEE